MFSSSNYRYIGELQVEHYLPVDQDLKLLLYYRRTYQ
jgi:hypothetical protein